MARSKAHAEEYLNANCTKALEWYEKAFAIVPSYYPVTKALVDCYLKLGRRNDAAGALDRFLALPYAGETPRLKARSRLDEIRGQS